MAAEHTGTGSTQSAVASSLRPRGLWPKQDGLALYIFIERILTHDCLDCLVLLTPGTMGVPTTLHGTNKDHDPRTSSLSPQR